uniref:Estradiol 17-beta-dehydrogenase 1 isoform X3 n=1 Tax=Callorhinus ursinus TaxID=34884 RepID=A0A3Q7N7E5_CALUR|nr:estradiol 17-beta-dehydrogenase 1 isoform X3 [Callorhinus ursinus]
MDRTVVLITGCSSGIGLHLALRLASDPSRSFKDPRLLPEPPVYATLRDLRAQGPLWEAARARGCPPGSLETLQLDVRDADSVAAARARVTEGRVDVLVCNAGRGLLGPLEVHTAGAVGSVLDVNVTGTVRTLQAFLPDMKRRRSGRILVTGSMGGLMGLPFNAVYCASKFAIEGLCESLAVLLPPFGVHVSLIECGPVRTAFLEKQEGVPGGALDGADAETRVLFSCYQRHLERIFREAAQDPEEVTEVGAGRGPGTGYGARGLAASPRPAPGQPPASALPPAAAGFPRRAARPASRAALLQHRELPTPGAPAPVRPQRLQLRRRHAPRGIRRRARGGGDGLGPRRPRAPRSSRRPAIKSWPAAVCRSLLCAPGARGSGGRRQAAGSPHLCDKWRVQRVFAVSLDLSKIAFPSLHCSPLTLFYFSSWHLSSIDVL